VGLRHWSRQRLAVLWLIGGALFAVEVAWLRHRDRVADEQFATGHGLHLEGNRLVPNAPPRQALTDSAEAITVVLLRPRARPHWQPLAASDSALERFAGHWRRLPRAALDSAWQGLAIAD